MGVDDLPRRSLQRVLPVKLPKIQNKKPSLSRRFFEDLTGGYRYYLLQPVRSRPAWASFSLCALRLPSRSLRNSRR